MNNVDKAYLELCKDVLENGVKKTDRTGTGTLSVFSRQLRFDLNEGFPLLTTKRVSFKLVLSELLWFLRGDTNIRFLLQHNNNIWNEWPFKKWVESDEYDGPDMTNFGIRSQQDPEFKKIFDIEMEKFKNRILNDDEFARKYGDIGKGYGKQWRNWEDRVDQIRNVIQQIKNNPDSRRHLVSAWNVDEVSQTVLPPCHFSFQFYVANNKLSCKFIMRSTDVFLGLPLNIASYATLTMMIAQLCNLELGELIYDGGDVHCYLNHIEQVKLQLSREPRSLPKLYINSTVKDIDDFTMNDFILDGYNPHPAIKAPIAV